jgi:predicted dehydrogenase
MSQLQPVSRRHFMKSTGLGVAGLLAAGSGLIPGLTLAAGPLPADIGSVKNGKIVFPEIGGSGDSPKGPLDNPLPPKDRIGFAVVALGRLTLEEILPAFAACKKAKLTALVSGTPDKAKAVAAQYGVPDSAIYDYKNFDSIKDNPDVQAVYIVLPNSMHRDFTERAARAGKHVLCEKPMATNSADARAMIAACDTAKVKLMIAYRCQYEPFNREVTRLSRSGKLGGIRMIEATNTQSQGTPDQWRLKKDLAGGGALPDIGLYCLNGVRALLGEEPDQVFAYLKQPKNDPRFKEVEEAVSFMMRFPSGVIANCATSYDARNSKDLTVRLEKGWIKLEGAFAYHGKSLRISQSIDDNDVITDVKLSEENQFALEIDHMAECIKNNVIPRTPGAEGLQDHIIMEAIYQSAATGKPVDLPPATKQDATRGPALKDN